MKKTVSLKENEGFLRQCVVSLKNEGCVTVFMNVTILIDTDFKLYFIKYT